MRKLYVPVSLRIVVNAVKQIGTDANTGRAP